MREIIANPEVRMVLGRAGENGVTAVIFDVVQEWQAEVGTGGTLQLLVQMDYQNTYPAVAELQGNKAVWRVTAVDTARSGDGQAQLSYLLNGKIAKSACYSYTVLPSLEETAGAVPPEQVNPWYTHIGQMAREAHTTAIDAKDSATKSAAAAKADAARAKEAADRAADKAPKTYTDTTFASAIRDTLVGTSVSTSIVSPVTHEVECKVYSENLISFPFREQPASWKGVAFNYENGVITANGTATDNIYLQLLPNKFKMGAGSYTISGCPKIKGCLIQANYDGKWGRYDSGDGASFAVENELVGLLVQINKGTTVNNAVFKPKLQLGTSATPFTPYIKDLAGITVTQNPGNKTFITGAGGRVSGMKSICPGMSIETDAPNVMIAATYNADTKKFIGKKFEELNNAILSMGGNI